MPGSECGRTKWFVQESAWGFCLVKESKHDNLALTWPCHPAIRASHPIKCQATPLSVQETLLLASLAIVDNRAWQSG